MIQDIFGHIETKSDEELDMMRQEVQEIMREGGMQ